MNIFVNGVQVNTNKSVSSMYNSKVFFSDGSWCDVKTGDVYNVGSGFISLGPSHHSQGAADPIKTEKTLEGTSIHLDGVNALYRIHTSEDFDNIKVTLDGPEDVVNSILVSNKGDEVWVEGGRGASMSGGISIGNIFGGRSVKMSNDPPCRVTVHMPLGVSVTLSGSHAGALIDDLNASFTLLNQGSGDVTVGNVKNLNASLQGSGDLEVAAVSGLVKISVQGSGEVNVQGGTASDLAVSLQGSGDVIFLGSADNANLLLQGSGDIRVRRASNVRKNKMGSGDIRVG